MDAGDDGVSLGMERELAGRRGAPGEAGAVGGPGVQVEADDLRLPLFGLGFNNFSVYYELVTGKSNWGPHSFYVALLVETGLVGALVFLVFLWYLFRCLHAARALGRTLALARDPAAARLRPLAWGLTAALVGTLAANFFYLTMTFYYFYVLAALVLAVPVVFGRRSISS